MVARVPLSLFVLQCVVFPSSVDRRETLGIMAGLYSKDWHLLGWLAGFSPRAVFPVVVVRPEMLGIMADMDQEDSIALFSGSGMCKVGFTGDSAPRAVFLFLLSSLHARHPGQYGPDGQLRGEILADMVPVVQTAENCGVSAVAVLQSRRQFLRGA